MSVGKFQFSVFKFIIPKRAVTKLEASLFTREVFRFCIISLAIIVIGRNSSQIGGDNCHSQCPMQQFLFLPHRLSQKENGIYLYGKKSYKSSPISPAVPEYHNLAKFLFRMAGNCIFRNQLALNFGSNFYFRFNTIFFRIGNFRFLI